MPTLTVGEMAFEVVGAIDWSTGGIENGRPKAAFIEAMVRVPSDVSTQALNQVSVRVVLEAGARSIEGDDMWQTDSLDLESNGLVLVRYGGNKVEER